LETEANMPKMTPDRDDARGQLAGNGGPQDGPICEKNDQHQQQEPDALEAAAGGQDSQRHPGGSSRDVKP
jgi:hypothetical protein